jgi:hypothetical protein
MHFIKGFLKSKCFNTPETYNIAIIKVKDITDELSVISF